MRMLGVFEKGMRLRHIGHLDIQRSMQRALRRSGLPVAYSKGFHPHILITFASALSTGSAGKREIMDVQLDEAVTPEQFLSQLNRALPPDMQLSFARELPDNHPALMATLQAAAYTLMPSDASFCRQVMDRLDDFLAQDEIMVDRKTKSGTAPCNIRPLIDSLFADEDGIHAVLTLSQTESCKPTMLLAGLQQFLTQNDSSEVQRVLITREQLYGRDERGALVPLELL